MNELDKPVLVTATIMLTILAIAGCYMLDPTESIRCYCGGSLELDTLGEHHITAFNKAHVDCLTEFSN